MRDRLEFPLLPTPGLAARCPLQVSDVPGGREGAVEAPYMAQAVPQGGPRAGLPHDPLPPIPTTSPQPFQEPHPS